ncbi:MAG: glycerol-3-phosphate 1-O-acyltransferase PlsY [Candidatus Margulisiibacteriota bacterium]|jgi:glycerol-3-phosphate acyltransferase PlsY
MDVLLLIVFAYLLGSIPFGLLISLLTRHQDLRQLGTKNAGASNTFLVVGPIAGISTAILDIAKGYIPALLAWWLFSSELVVGLVGLAAVCGHIWPIFFKFKGGKGVATASGVCFCIAPGVFALSVLIWFVLVATWRYVTLSNVVIFMLMPLLFLFFGLPNETVGFALALSLIIAISHRENIDRFLKGQEPTLLDILKLKKRELA